MVNSWAASMAVLYMRLRLCVPNTGPPYSPEAEQCLLAAILTDSRAFEIVAPLVVVDDFYVDANRRIYQACCDLQSVSQPIDLTTVSAQLGPVHLPAIGGISYLSTICDVTPTVANLGAYCRIISEKSLLRRAIETCNLISSHAAKPPKNVPEFIEKAEKAIYDLARGKSESAAPVGMYDLSLSALNRLKAAAERGGEVAGTATGFADLDRMTTGLHPGELIILAARPGMGKSGLAAQVSLNVALGGQGALFFSLEMPKEQIADRLIGAEARVSVRDLRTGQVHGDAWDSMVESAERVSRVPMWVDDTPALSLMLLRSKIRRKQAEFDNAERKVSIVIVDYLQLMRSGKKTDSRENEIGEISRGLKAIAKELSVPVIALSQLNREVEKRQGKRPQMSDLRDSGSLEQDADMIMFIFREEYYAIMEKRECPTHLQGVADVVIAKQRNGAPGELQLKFESTCVRFDNMERR